MPSSMLQALLNAFRIPDLRQKLLFTLGLLVAFRFIAHSVPRIETPSPWSLVRILS